MALNTHDILSRISDIKSTPVADTRGKKFEELSAHLFESVGCIVRRDLITPLGSQQIDLAVAHMGILGPIPNFFLVECKYWDKPVDSAAVGYFLKTCEDRRAALGVIVSRNGITGNVDDSNRAHSLAFASHCRGTSLMVLDEADLLSITCETDLITLLIRAWMQAAATGAVGRP